MKNTTSGVTLLRRSGILCWWNSHAIAVAEEQHTCFLALCTFVGLHPLTSTYTCPHALQEAEAATPCIAAIVLPHDGLNRLGCFISVVKRDRADIVVKDMGLNDAVKEGSTDESEFPIDCCSSTSSVGPSCRCVMR